MKILTAIDGSRYSTWAIDALRRLPLAGTPQIRILHVLEQAVLVRPWIAPPLVSQPSADRRKAVQRAGRLTQRAAGRLSRRWKSVRTLVERGPVADTIARTAGRERADLLVMGSRGLSDVQAFLMGSVSQQAVTYAPCSVLVVKKPLRSVRTVLLAADGSVWSRRALAFLIALLQPAGIDVVVLTVQDASIVDDAPADETTGPRVLQTLRRAGFAARALPAAGHAAAMIIDAARRHRADLVIVGSRGLTGLRRFLLGSVSRQVVKYCPCAVLVVRGRPGQSSGRDRIR